MFISAYKAKVLRLFSGTQGNIILRVYEKKTMYEIGKDLLNAKISNTLVVQTY